MGDVEAPPSPLAGDVFKVIILCVLFIVGSPLNALATCFLRNAGFGPLNSLAKETNTLKKHLNYSDLLVIFVYTSSEIGWLLSYSWRGGWVLCKGVAFVRLLCFQISSNVMVAIAAVRLASTVSPVTGHRRTRRLNAVLGLAWALALLTSAPQFFVWTTYRPFPGHRDWVQCMTVFEIEEHRNTNGSIVNGEDLRLIYTIYHVAMVFWIPFLLIGVLYLSLVVSIWGFGRREARKPGSLLNPADRTTYTFHVPQLHINGSEQGNSQILVTSDTQLVAADRAPGTAEAVTNVAASEDVVAASKLRSIRSARRATVRVWCVLTVAYLLCFSPYLAIETWKVVNKESYHIHGQGIPQVMNTAIVINSVINPFLYGMFSAASEGSCL